MFARSVRYKFGKGKRRKKIARASRRRNRKKQ